MSARYTVLLVQSTNHALRAENILNKAGIACKLIPVPRYLSSDCGVCLLIATDDKQAALRALVDAHLTPEAACDL